MLVPHDTMIFVADASGMRLLRNQAAIGCPRLQLLEDEKWQPLSRMSEDNRPGRVFESVGVVRHAYPVDDRHDASDKSSAARAIHRLCRRVDAEAGAKVIMIAPPRMLGFVRALYTKRLADDVLQEIDKGLTHLSPSEIGSFLDRYRDQRRLG